MTTTLANERIFDFFGLPRELRNEIYSNLTSDITLASGLPSNSDDETYLEVVMKDGPRSELLLLSRQLKTEYEEHINRTKAVVIKDTGGSLDEPELGVDLKFSKVTIHIFGAEKHVDSCEELWQNAVQDIPHHRVWVDNFLGNHGQLGEITISLYLQSTCEGRLQWAQHSEAAKIAVELEKLTSISKLKTLKVYTFSWPQSVAKKDRDWKEIYKCYRGPVTEWTASDGWKKQGWRNDLKGTRRQQAVARAGFSTKRMCGTGTADIGLIVVESVCM